MINFGDVFMLRNGSLFMKKFSDICYRLNDKGFLSLKAFDLKTLRHVNNPDYDIVAIFHSFVLSSQDKTELRNLYNKGFKTIYLDSNNSTFADDVKIDYFFTFLERNIPLLISEILPCH